VEISDCSFAAAADWEMADLGYTPSEARVRREYFAAGGSWQEGLAQTTWEHWWLTRGIGGVHVRLHEVPGENDMLVEGALPASASSRLRHLLGEYHYLLAELGDHEVLLIGYTDTGPTYVTFGEERQMTWAEWRGWSHGLYVPSVVHSGR